MAADLPDVPVVGDAQTFRQRSDAMQWTSYGDYQDQDYPLVEYWGTAASATANGHHRLHRIPNDVLFRAFADSAGDERIQRDLLALAFSKLNIRGGPEEHNYEHSQREIAMKWKRATQDAVNRQLDRLAPVLFGVLENGCFAAKTFVALANAMLSMGEEAIDEEGQYGEIVARLHLQDVPYETAKDVVRKARKRVGIE